MLWNGESFTFIAPGLVRDRSGGKASMTTAKFTGEVAQE